MRRPAATVPSDFDATTQEEPEEPQMSDVLDASIPEYDGPSAPPVFVVLEGDRDVHELKSGKHTITKKFEPLKRGIQIPKPSNVRRGSSHKTSVSHSLFSTIWLTNPTYTENL